VGKISPKIFATSAMIKNTTQSKQSPLGENSPNLFTLDRVHLVKKISPEFDFYCRYAFFRETAAVAPRTKV
jgi:hypothetical protein